MKRKVTFLIPASPTPAFFSQIAAFELALSCLRWENWEATTLVCLGEDIVDNQESFERWRPHLRRATFVVAPPIRENVSYHKQTDGVYKWAPRDSDVYVRVDADVLPVGNLEGILDFVHERQAIAGTIAHYKFPTLEGMGNRQSWILLAKEFANTEPRFSYNYSLSCAGTPREERETPFYLNDGCVFFARTYFDKFAPQYLEIASQLRHKIANPYFSGQISLALAVMNIRQPAIALPLRYNFPNDPLAAKKYPEEMMSAKVIHYLRTEQFDRQRIFQSAENWEEFLSSNLNEPNQKFRDGVRRLFGDSYQFVA